MSYYVLRTRRTWRHHRLERIADGVFIFGLIVMVMVCSTIVYEIL